MSWPQSQDYNEAIQNAKICFKDTELSKGQAVTNAMGMPLPCSGNFADVYQVNCPETKSRWAVKCFTRGDPAALAQRYAKIDEHLQKVKLPFTVGFRFLEEGIRVRNQWHPVLKMQWVEGFTLNQFVRDNLDKPNLLEALLQIWVRMAKRLREADMAHADLQHGNVLLVPGATANALSVKLIDYDGMWVPALAGQKSGEVGHPAYQHTKRLYEGTYSKEVDRFPLLVVATALRSLRVVGKPLWEKFDNGDNLLFREADLAAPERSPLFAELEKIQDAQAKLLVETVRNGCSQPLEEAPFVDELLSEGLPARKPGTTTATPAVSPSRTNPAAMAASPPPPADAFAGLGDEGPPATTKTRKPQRRGGEDPAAPEWKKWAMIGGGGAGAVLLAVVLVVAMSGGDNNKPDKTDKPDDKSGIVNKDNRKDGNQPQPLQLSVAEMPNLHLTAGQSEQVSVQVKGVKGAADFATALTSLPTGVTAEKVSSDPLTGRAVWKLKADAATAAGEQRVVVTASAGDAKTQGSFRLTVERPSAAVSIPEKVQKAMAAHAETLGKAVALLTAALEKAEKDIQSQENLKPEERAKLLGQAGKEKQEFIQRRMVPQSPRWKAEAAEYERALAAADAALTKVYDEAIDAYKSAGDLAKTDAMRAERQVLGRWSVKVSTYLTEWAFFPDGLVTSTSGAPQGKWRIEQQGQTQRILIVWSMKEELWDSLDLPLDPKKSFGSTVHNKNIRVEAEKLAVVARPPDSPTEPLRAKAPFDAKSAKALQQAWADHLKRKVEEEYDLGDGVKLTVVLIPPGMFRLGSPEGEKDRGPAEELHTVEITKPFYLGKFEVTQEQYMKVTGEANPSKFKDVDPKRFPVENVSWDMADGFCKKLGAKLGHQAGLPSEAQWEYACRAGTETPFHFGGSLNGAEANCVGSNPYGTDRKGPFLRKTVAIGSYDKYGNAFGLYDLHGNVWEWCQDYYGPYTGLPLINPIMINKVSESARVARGGSWTSHAGGCRASFRHKNAPASRADDLGFRVAFHLEGRPPEPVATPAKMRMEKFAAAVAQEKSIYNTAVNKAADSYKEQLQAILQEETKAGNLTAALAVREEIKTLETDGLPLFSAKGNAPAIRGKVVPGVWSLKYHPAQTGGTIVIRPNGEMTDLDGKKRGRLKPQGPSFLQDPFTERPERYTFAGNRLFIEHYFSLADYEKNEPAQIGVCEWLRAVPAAPGDSKPSGALIKAEKEFAAGVSKVKADYNVAVTKAIGDHRKLLQSLLQEQTQAGNLDAALAIQNEIKAADADSPPLFPDKADTPTARPKWVSGTWNIKYHPNKTTASIVILANGQVLQEGKPRRQLTVQGNLAVMALSGTVERLTFGGGRLFVEHYNPAGNFAKNVIDQIGVAELAKK